MNARLALSLTASVAVMLLAAPQLTQAAQPSLTGVVSSAEEGNMEGVVVSAHKDGSIITVSVTTDAQGRYTFPENRLEPGKYNLEIRAVGYDIGAPTTAQVAADKTASADIKLVKTKDLPSQLTNAEWMLSIPGTDDQKAMLLNCTSCHTVQRIVRSTHDANEFMNDVLPRMAGYGAVSQPIKPQPMLDRDRVPPPERFRRVAEYLATINLSTVDHWQYQLRTLPRPTGRSTRAIVTEYALGRPTIEPHDVLVQDGKVWYTDFGSMYIGEFDPKTLKLTEHSITTYKPGAPVGLLSIQPDRDGKLWFDTMYQGALGSLDTKTKEIKYYPLDPKWNDVRVQLNFVGLHHEVDNKVWTKSVGTQDIFRVDLTTGQWEKFHPTDKLPKLADGNYGIYQVASDSHNNLWMAEFTEGHLGKIDAKTLEVTWYAPPTAHARLRRMVIDENDQVIVTEYRGNKVAVFDPKTEKFTEYALPTQFTNPYRADFDKNGEIWTGGMATDRVVRYNPKTLQNVEYMMPKDTNMRTVFIDNSTNPVTFWVGSNHDAALVKVEPLD
jgi:streptogramin lyase